MTNNITADFIQNHSLMDCLREFDGAHSKGVEAKIKELNGIFYFLAQKMLYGGYLKVGDDYEIYITKVEFYYHEEDKSDTQITDPIVYHRNGRFPGRDVPPFPIMTLHSHWSGYDITFEDPQGHYRASALIREYVVYDNKRKEGPSFVKWNSSADSGTQETDAKGQRIMGEYEPSNTPFVDNRSSFLQYYLNGFQMDGTPNRIRWIDFTNPDYKEPMKGIRKNTGDKKEWAFRRTDDLKELRRQ